jgi:hypothetical protein
VASKDRMNFAQASKDLGISEDELEQLVANGEIAGTKEGDTIFFKPEVVAQFKKSRKTEPTIILADSDMDILDGLDAMDLGGKKGAPGLSAASLDDVVIEPRSAEGKAAKKAEVPSADDTVLNLDGLLEDDGSEGTTPIPGAVDESADITVEGNISDETLLDTNLLEIGDEPTQDSFKLDTTASDEGVTEPMESMLLRGGGARAMQMKRKKSHAGWTIAMVLTALLLLVPLGITLNILFVTKSMAEGTVPEGKDPKAPKGQKSVEVYKWVFDLDVMPGLYNGIADMFSS